VFFNCDKIYRTHKIARRISSQNMVFDDARLLLSNR